MWVYCVAFGRVPRANFVWLPGGGGGLVLNTVQNFFQVKNNEEDKENVLLLKKVSCINCLLVTFIALFE